MLITFGASWGGKKNLLRVELGGNAAQVAAKVITTLNFCTSSISHMQVASCKCFRQMRDALLLLAGNVIIDIDSQNLQVCESG